MPLLFTGMVLALQTSYSLAAYGGKPFVGDIIALSVVRELGPVLTALVVAGRVGAGITAELHVYPGACHGFEMIVPTAAVSIACQRDMTEALRRVLSAAPAAVAG